MEILLSEEGGYVGQAKIMDVFYPVIHFLQVAKYIYKKKNQFSYFLGNIRWCPYLLALASVKSLFPFSHSLLLLIFMALFFFPLFLPGMLLAIQMSHSIVTHITLENILLQATAYIMMAPKYELSAQTSLENLRSIYSTSSQFHLVVQSLTGA